MIKQLLIICFLAGLAVPLASQSFTNTTQVKDLGERQIITAIAIDSDNNKYVGTEHGLLKISAEGVVETMLPGVYVHAVTWSKREGLWAAIDSNILVHTDSGERMVLDGEQLRIQSMDFSGAQLWVGTNEGLHVVSVRRDKVTKHYTPKNSKMLSSNVRVVYVDDSMIKWIGTDQGVLRVVNDKWKLYEKEERITAISSNIEGVWIASEREMWLVDAYNRWYPTDVKDGLSNGSVRALTADNKGKLYILSEILVQFDPYEDTTVEIAYDHAPKGKSHVAIMCDLNDNLWMGSLEEGLVTLNMASSESEPFEAFVAVQHPKCAGESNGSITINASGGAPPYDFAWSDAALTGRSPQGLGPGNYSVTVTDADNGYFVHDISLEAAQPLVVSLEVGQPVSQQGASDGVVTVDAHGGTGDYNYTWSNGTSRHKLEGVTAGTYTLTITDREGCTAVAQMTLPDGPVVIGEALAEADAIEDEGEIPEPTSEPLESVDIEKLKSLDAASLALGQTLRIEQLFFEADSSVVKPESHAVLNEIYQFLRNNERIVIEIGGHTNGLPEHDYCDRLSEARAKHVAEYLYRRGIPTDRIAYKGYGKRQPIATNETVIGRRQNQRVEIKILEI